MYSYPRHLALLLCLLLVITACNDVDNETDTAAPPETDEPAAETTRTAVAELEPTEGNDATGRVTFTEEPAGVRVVGEVEGLEPGPHGFHVHEFGDCSAPDASSAGDHFDPLDNPHGGPDDPTDERHVGDLGNIVADEDGVGYYEHVDEVISFDDDRSIIGRAVVVHADEDDLESQPSGDAGDRLACGVIEMDPNRQLDDTDTAPGTNEM